MIRNLLLVISFVFASVNVFATENKDAPKDEAQQVDNKAEANVDSSDVAKKDKKEEAKK
jgi:hypothetical protein